ncbi:hypothetical protein ACOMHN_007152 [Nucella lapillus]
MKGVRGLCVPIFVGFFCLLQLTFSQQQNVNFEGLLTAIAEGGNSVEDEAHLFHSLIPTTPSPEDINCYVEIAPPIQMVGGVCKRIGPRFSQRRSRYGRRRMSFRWACQAGVHLEINSPDCGSQSRRSRQMGG